MLKIIYFKKCFVKIDMGKYVIPELDQLCKQISVFHEIDFESQKEYGHDG